jgi:HAD superfamily hydrolase (TIGR01490 family)
MPRAAAFFDLDKTLIGRAAYRRGLVTRRQLAKDLWANIRFRLRGSTDQETDALRARILDAVAGRSVAELSRLAPEVLAGILPRVYPEMLDVAWGHQDAGRPVYIVTAASQEIAEMLASVLGFDGGIGVRSEIRDGYYTGRPDGPFTYRDGKPVAMREVAERDDLGLADSWAYSDSESDLPMLRAVGHPVAVNPDVPLMRVAREEGWQVMTFDRLRRRVRLAAVALGLGGLSAGGGWFVATRSSRRVSPAPVARRSRVRAGRGRALLGW